MTQSTSSGPLHDYAAAWLRGDHPYMFDKYADDIVVHYGGTSRYAGTYRGKAAFLDALVESSIRSQRALLKVDAVYETDTAGAIFTTESLVLDGEARTVNRALRFRIDANRIVECWLYDQDQHLVDAAWSSAD